MNKENNKKSDLNLKRCYAFPRDRIVRNGDLKIQEQKEKLTLGDFVKRFEFCKWTPGFTGKIGKSDYHHQINQNGSENVFLCQDFATVALRSTGKLEHMPMDKLLVVNGRFNEKSDKARSERNTGSTVYKEFKEFGKFYFKEILDQPNMSKLLRLNKPMGFGKIFKEAPTTDWTKIKKRNWKCANCNNDVWCGGHTCRACQHFIHKKCRTGIEASKQKFQYDGEQHWVCEPCQKNNNWNVEDYDDQDQDL